MIPLNTYQFLQPNYPAVKSDGTLDRVFYFLLQSLFQRTGGNNGIPLKVDDAVAAAGTTQATATPLVVDLNNVTTGGGGVSLAMMQAGEWQLVVNSLATTLKVYPPLGGEIDSAGTTNSAVSLPAGATQIFFCFAVNDAGAPDFNVFLPAARTKLTADTTFYVSTTGSDTSGDGSQGNPWLTGQNAGIQIIRNYDAGSHKVTLQLVGSPFNVPAGQSFFFGFAAPVGIQELIIRGDPASPSSFVVDGSLTTRAGINIGADAIGLRLVIDGIQLQNFSAAAIASTTPCFIDIGAITFANNSGTVIDAEAGAQIAGRTGTWTFTGTQGQLCYVGFAQLDTNNAPIVFTAGAAFTFAVLNVDTNGFCHFYNNVTGTCTGPRVFLNRGGLITAVTAGGGSDLPFASLPGDSNGTINGGWYNNELAADGGTFTAAITANSAAITATITGASLATTGQAGIGYGPAGAGTGGSVTQITSKATAVTLNTIAGQITTSNSALLAGQSAVFQVNNSTVAATDVVILNLTGGFSNYEAGIAKVAAGVFVIYVINTSAGSLSDALTFNFAVIKGVAT